MVGQNSGFLCCVSQAMAEDATWARSRAVDKMQHVLLEKVAAPLVLVCDVDIGVCRIVCEADGLGFRV